LKSFKQILTEAENKIAGIAAAPGIVIAKVYLYTKEKLKINDGVVTDEDEAIKNLHDALNKSKKELNKIFSFAKERMDPDRAGIFEAQIMILDDPVLIDIIVHRIKEERRQPEYIVNDEISKYQELMRNAHESYMNERASDIEDIKNRIIRNLQKKRWESKIASELIVVSDSLTPADTILLSRSNVKGFVTDHGGLTSHAAIISRSLNIPAVVGAHNATLKIKDGDTQNLVKIAKTVLGTASEPEETEVKTEVVEVKAEKAEKAEAKAEKAPKKPAKKTATKDK